MILVCNAGSDLPVPVLRIFMACCASCLTVEVVMKLTLNIFVISETNQMCVSILIFNVVRIL